MTFIRFAMVLAAGLAPVSPASAALAQRLAELQTVMAAPEVSLPRGPRHRG